jgi:3-hydroxyacyl-[acyl-carrier-protein] dehydratase
MTPGTSSAGDAESLESRRLALALGALPHGRQFRFVDVLLELDPGRSGVGEYRLPDEAEFLRGHFPGEPMMPGVLLVEAVAQLGGVVAQSDPAIPPLTGLKLTGIRAAKITGTARPGDRVDLRATVAGRMGHLVQITGSAWVEGRELLRCEVTLAGVR